MSRALLCGAWIPYRETLDSTQGTQTPPVSWEESWTLGRRGGSILGDAQLPGQVWSDLLGSGGQGPPALPAPAPRLCGSARGDAEFFLAQGPTPSQMHELNCKFSILGEKKKNHQGLEMEETSSL